MRDKIIAERYQIEHELGRGGMGTVYAARNLATGREVALKIPHPELVADEHFLRRFIREVRAAAKLRSPNVIDILDVVRDENGVPVAVMERLEGAPLSDVLATRGRLSLVETSSVVAPVLTALHEAHEAGIVHRDIKPENVFVSTNSSHALVPKLLDFGVARLVGPLSEDGGGTTQTGAMVGSPYYMAPEQVSGRKDVDRRADVWAAGVLVYECLAGERPIGGENFGQIFTAILQGEIVPLAERDSSLPDGVTRAVSACLVRDREMRAPSLLSLIAALEPHATMTTIDPWADVVSAERAPTIDSRDAGRAVDPEAATVDSGAHADHALVPDLPEPTDATVTPAPERGSPRARIALAALAAAAVVGGSWLLFADDDAIPPAPIPDPAEPADPDDPTYDDPETAAILEAADAADWELRESLARRALQRSPSSRRARYLLAWSLMEHARLGSTGRIAALREAQALAVDLERENPDNPAALQHIAIGRYLMRDYVGALEQHARLPDETRRRLDIPARIAWYAGWDDFAQSELARCLEVRPDSPMCLLMRHFDVEMQEGRAGLERLREDPQMEAGLPASARVRVRVALGRLDEAELLIETGDARGDLDDLDRPWTAGLLAAARGERAVAAAHLATIEALSRDPDVLPAVRCNGVLQGAELAAALGDREAVLRAAELGLELGFWKASFWENMLAYAPYQADLAAVIASSRERSRQERARAARWIE